MVLNKKNVIVMSETQNRLSQMGEQIKLAGLRRNLPVELVSERAGISRTTLWAIEKGSRYFEIIGINDNKYEKKLLK